MQPTAWIFPLRRRGHKVKYCSFVKHDLSSLFQKTIKDSVIQCDKKEGA